MIKNILLGMCLVCTGCVVYLEPGSSESYESYGSHEPLDFWFDDTYVSCDYEEHTDGASWWLFYASLDGPWAYDGSSQILAVDVDIYDVYWGYQETYELTYRGGLDGTAPEWGQIYGSWDLDCYYSYDFEFVAYDAYGPFASSVVYW